MKKVLKWSAIGFGGFIVLLIALSLVFGEVDAPETVTPRPTRAPTFTAPTPTLTTTEAAILATAEAARATTEAATFATATRVAAPQVAADAVAETLTKGNRGVKRVEKVALSDEGAVTVQWAINDNLTSGLRKGAARRDVVKILRAVQWSGVSYESILVVGTFSMVDRYGNVSESPVIRALYNRSTVEKIKWDTFRADNVWWIADGDGGGGGGLGEYRAFVHRDFRD